MGERTQNLTVSSEIYTETNFRSFKSQDGSKFKNQTVKFFPQSLSLNL